ncbi:MAG: tetratricopeptide repeat-containing protein [Dysgonomonas sp.]
MEKQKMCFVIMGFGKKKDPVTNRTIDLDKTFRKIIRPAVQACNYCCIRADEITDSGIIDRSMYALLYSAELVIADISTYNPNAIYELGTRHALKPFSTIIIKEDEGNIPFDINHNRILNYKHLGNEISESEAKKSTRELKELIISITNNPTTDSPLYSFIPQIKRPILSDSDLNEIIGELRSKEDTVYALMESAKQNMVAKNFVEAAKKWKKLNEKTNNETFFIQQQALCTYKSKEPSPTVALTNALQIINTISSVDTETLGISGAINKNLWKCTGDINFLDTAIELYKKGWNLHNDYYTGENYAHCLERKSFLETDNDLKIYYQVEAKKTRRQTIEIILPTFEDIEPEEVMWKYATLSNCYRSLKDIVKADEYEQKFYSNHPNEWQIETFSVSKNEIIEITQ